MTVSEAKKDQIVNGVSAGMLLEDMFILSDCSPDEIIALQADQFFMSRCKQAGKRLELDLLSTLNNIISIQEDKGKDHATIWLLGKMNPRFSDHPEMGDKPGIINIHNSTVTLESLDTVEVFNPEPLNPVTGDTLDG